MGCNSSKNQINTKDLNFIVNSINDMINKQEEKLNKYKLIDLGFGYSKNKIHVYYNGHVLENALPSSFTVDDKYFAHDIFSYYFKGEEISRF